MARTQEQDDALTVMADAKIKADAVEVIGATLRTNMDAIQATYDADSKVAHDEAKAAFAALEG